MTITERPGPARWLTALPLLEALTTPHGIDRYLELAHPMLTVRELRAEVTRVHRHTPDTITLTLRPHRRWRRPRAGQYVRITVDVDGVRRTRCYSPTNSEHDAATLELTVKAHQEGVVSRYLHRTAAPGLVVGLSQPEGTFALPARRPDRIVLISGGSGITPVLAMLRTLCDEAHPGRITFLHYARSEADVPHLAELRALAAVNPNVDLVLGYTETDGGDLTGFFDADHLATAAPDHADAQTYLCGPPALMASVRAIHTDAGLADALHTEDFAPAPLAAAGEAGGTVSYARSSVDADNTGASLLEQAEAAGLTPEHGCRMGICFSCTAVKRRGTVRDLRTGTTSSDEDEEIQLCVNAPVGDVTVDI